MSLKHCRNKRKPMATSMSMRRAHSTWELDIPFKLKWLDYIMPILRLHIDLDQLRDEATPWFMLVTSLKSSSFLLFLKIWHTCNVSLGHHGIILRLQVATLELYNDLPHKMVWWHNNLHQSISPFAYFLGICSNSKGMVILVGVTFLSFAYIGLYFLVKWSPKTSTSYLPK